MNAKSKIIFFLIITLIAVSVTSCKKSKYDVIPYTHVDFTINLSDPEFIVLQARNNYKIITSATNNWGERSAGWDGNGIIVYRSSFDDFYAYDRTCPHDYDINGLSIKVNIDFTTAICPQCSTYYSLDIGGTPFKGIGKYPLKNYRTSFDGQFVYVHN